MDGRNESATSMWLEKSWASKNKLKGFKIVKKLFGFIVTFSPSWYFMPCPFAEMIVHNVKICSTKIEKNYLISGNNRLCNFKMRARERDHLFFKKKFGLPNASIFLIETSSTEPQKSSQWLPYQLLDEKTIKNV